MKNEYVNYAIEAAERVWEHYCNMNEIMRPDGVSEEEWAGICVGAMAGIAEAIQARYVGAAGDLAKIAHARAHEDTVAAGEASDRYDNRDKN